MIFIYEKGLEIPIKFPRNCFDTFDSYKLVIYSQGRNYSYYLVCEDASGLTDYYVFTPNFGAVENGEYEYEILGIQDENELSIGAKGLIQVGDRTMEIKSYESEVNYTYYGSEGTE